jgi:HlyD family secretion protein
MRSRWRTPAWTAAALVALGLLALALRPAPIEVDVATVGRGPLQVTVDEDGETRAHDRFVVSAAVAGRVARIELHEGDRVERDQVLTEIWSLPLSAREREEQLSRISAAEAVERQAAERVRHAQADFEQARRERVRIEELARSGFASQQQREQATVLATTSANELEAARFQARAAEAEAAAARAALLAIDASPRAGASVKVRAPVAGKVLRIPERSERVVAAGTPLLTIGDPTELEIVIDLLSNEAVKVTPGMPVLLTGWGGEQPLRARVRLVEPYGFTKVSALGVEEQRVNVIADFVDPPGPLGDGYRVDAKIVLWQGDDVLLVPSSALFRRGDGWSAFVVEGGRARRREVEPGQRGALEVEVLAGLSPGEVVIRQPPNDVDEGVRVRAVEESR